MPWIQKVFARSTEMTIESAILKDPLHICFNYSRNNPNTSTTSSTSRMSLSVYIYINIYISLSLSSPLEVSRTPIFAFAWIDLELILRVRSLVGSLQLVPFLELVCHCKPQELLIFSIYGVMIDDMIRILGWWVMGGNILGIVDDAAYTFEKDSGPQWYCQSPSTALQPCKTSITKLWTKSTKNWSYTYTTFFQPKDIANPQFHDQCLLPIAGIHTGHGLRNQIHGVWWQNLSSCRLDRQRNKLGNGCFEDKVGHGHAQTSSGASASASSIRWWDAPFLFWVLYQIQGLPTVNK